MGGTKYASSSATQQLPDYLNTAYQNIVGNAGQTASSPYTPYTGGFTADQKKAFENIGSLWGSANPMFSSSSEALSRAMVPTSTNVSQYMSPYMEGVIAPMMDVMQEQNQRQQQGVVGNAIARGAFGGNRVGVAQGELARQQKLADNQALGALYQQGYGQALSAAQADKMAALDAAAKYAGLGQTQVNTGLAQAAAQLGAGTQQQQFDYQQYLNALAFPYQQQSWLASIAGGLGPSAGGTTTESKPQGNIFSQLLGTGLGIASLFRDGGRVHAASGGVMGMIPYANDNAGWPSYMGAAGLMPYANDNADFPGYIPQVAIGGGGSGVPRAVEWDPSESEYDPWSHSDAMKSGAGNIKSWIRGPMDLGLASGGVVPTGYAEGGFVKLIDGNGNFAGYGPMPDSGGFTPQGTKGDRGRRIDPLNSLGEPWPGPVDQVVHRKPAPARLSASVLPPERYGSSSVFEASPAALAYNRTDDGRYSDAVVALNGAAGAPAALQPAVKSTIPPVKSSPKAAFSPVQPVGRAEPERDVAVPSRSAITYDHAPVSAAGQRFDVMGNDMAFQPKSHQTSSRWNTGYAEGGVIGRTPYAPGGLVKDEFSTGSQFVTTPTPGYSTNIGEAFNSMREGNGLNLSPDMRQSLLSAAAGMASSKSPFFLAGVGEGVQSGINTWNERQKLERENAAQRAANAQTGAGIIEAMERAGLTNAMKIREQQATLIDQWNMTPTMGGMMVQDKVNPELTRIIPYDQLAGWMAEQQNVAPQAEVAAPIGAGLTPVESAAPAPRKTDEGIRFDVQVPANIRPSSMAMTPQGEQIVIPQTNTALQQAQKDNAAANDATLQLAAMRHAAENLPATGILAPGAWAEQRANMVKGLNTGLRMLGLEEIDPNAIASIEEMNKLTTQFGFQLARTTGSDVASSVIAQGIGAVPSIENSPQGFRAITSLIQASLNRTRDWNDFLNAWVKKTGGDSTGANTAFAEMYPPSAYAEAAVLDSAIIPQTQADIDNAPPGTLFNIDGQLMVK